MKTRILVFLLCFVLVFSGCSGNVNNITEIQGSQPSHGEPDSSVTETQGESADLGDENMTFGEDIDEMGAYDGYFEGESTDFSLAALWASTTERILNTTFVRFQGRKAFLVTASVL